ncbi:CPBP family intramembrane glutamic endopeptidase [Microterricola pindariensis]|uniref:CAAX protease family protein n=1 Tax=Microterricola pindariensis TaxID=478010 RepID=A0ABX5ARR6_9MICO|nr:CPBP family intramembrane glutamic endopeptidase [Microterricola pindariensis]PPL14985.1 CAAX protease family protein [Microterricola pindariensis]
MTRERELLVTDRAERRRIWIEVVIVLGLSLGASAVYSIVSLVAKLTKPVPLGDQSTALNTSQSTREWLDFTYQFLNIFFALFAVALVLYLLWRPGRSPFRRIGFDLSRPGRDLGAGLALAALIGIPGIALYLGGRALGITVAVSASPLDTFWWTIPILLLSAANAALSEEIIVVGYLFTRLHQLGWNRWAIILGSATLRGSYHLYQGIGPFFGNLAMGVLFGWCYEKWGRTMPLVVAHWILDAASFVLYPLAVLWFPTLFGA